jgi:signal transduction histidine kinase
MYSVIQNLVTNAVKFARPGVPPVVRVTSHRVEGGHRVSVIDNGVGIAPERRDDVFSMFTTSGRGGHGIGLATVHRVVTAQGGELGITDAACGGAEVWFTLPD